jgi:hypothetical protein
MQLVAEKFQCFDGFDIFPVGQETQKDFLGHGAGFSVS